MVYGNPPSSVPAATPKAPTITAPDAGLAASAKSARRSRGKSVAHYRDTILIIDNGGQLTNKIWRAMMDVGVYAVVVPHNTEIFELHVPKENIRGIILSGGPASVYENDAPKLPFWISVGVLGVPVLGICYGMQALAWARGGEVKRAQISQYGTDTVVLMSPNKLFRGVPDVFKALVSHGDEVTKLPKGFVPLANSNGSLAAMADVTQGLYAVQFHPESVDTEFGKQILSNFATGICCAKRTWSFNTFVKEKMDELKATVSEGQKILCFVSGGVDSTTMAVLLHRLFGGRVTSVFIDTGGLRKNEADDTMALFSRLGITVKKVDASAQFLEALKGITEPEKKRAAFIRVYHQVREQLGNEIGPFDWFAQGTIQSDIIESAKSSKSSDRIKTHHNVGEEPEWLKKIPKLEPLKELFKDDVRKLSRSLGLPRELFEKHPFPGPGLYVRIIGEVTPDKLRICREASAIVEEEIKAAGWDRRVSQAFAAVGDDTWVGVKGDARAVGHIVYVKATSSKDMMTNTPAPLPAKVLERIADRIPAEVAGVVAVYHGITKKPPETTEPN